MELSRFTQQLDLPSLSVEQLGFCQSTLAGIKQWTDQLPMANTGAAAKHLFQALPTINQWQTKPELRLQCLDTLRPYVQDICHLLQQHYSMVDHLQPRQIKIANLNRALQLQLLIGYEQCAVELIKMKKSQAQIALAIYRALNELELILLESLRLHTAPPSRIWRDSHILLQLAEALDGTQIKVTQSSRVIDPYLKIILLSACRPNNLRPDELSAIHQAMDLWIDKVNLKRTDIEDCLFIVNLEHDQGARYRQHIESLAAPNLRGMDTKRLVQLLKYAADHPQDKSDITIPPLINQHLLDHLTSSWGVQWQRTFDRIIDSGQLQMSVGIAASHYVVCDHLSFENFVNWQEYLQKTTATEAMASSPAKGLTKSIQSRSSKADIWANAFDADMSEQQTALSIDDQAIDFPTLRNKPASEPGRYPSYSVAIINASTGGYCIRWQGEIASNLQAGEVLSLRAKNDSNWSIGTLRWIRHDHNQDMLAGIEILANKTLAAFSRKLEKTGDNGPRVKTMILPEIQSISQPASIIVPQLTFQSGHQISLNYEGVSQRIVLTEKLYETNSLLQFSYRVISQNTQAAVAEPYELLNLDDAPIPSPDSFDNL